MKNPLLAPVLLLLIAPGLAQTAQPKPVAALETAPGAVNLYFTVRDSSGALLANLPQESFQVREEGRPQNIRYFSSKSNAPLTLGLLLETSGYMRGALLTEKSTAADFIRIVSPQDLAFIMSFDMSADLLQDLTSDVRLLRNAVDKATINTGGRSGGRAAITLHDAVFLAADEILRKQAGRKILVILTSGMDQGSKVKLKEAIEAAQRADAICYVVLFFHRPGSSGPDIRELAEQTGGRAFAATNPAQLTDALSHIVNEMRSFYRVSYIPDNPGPADSFRRIEITSHEGHRVQVRKGYYPQP
ncbi:MAG TPA: VWA domain-containing protein [Candidatus Angelobacter sp.]